MIDYFSQMTKIAKLLIPALLLVLACGSSGMAQAQAGKIMGFKLDPISGAGLSKRDRIQQVQCVSVIAVDHLEDLINGNFKRPESPLMVDMTIKNPPLDGQFYHPLPVLVFNDRRL
jgi:hypothetical protein